MKRFFLIHLIIGLFTVLSVAVNPKENKSDVFTLDKVFQMDKNGTLDLRSNDAQVTITGSDRSDIRIKVYRHLSYDFNKDTRGKFNINIEEKNGNIIVREDNPAVKININLNRKLVYTIDVELPNSASLKIVGDDDDYNIENVNGDIAMIVDDGDILLNNCRGKLFDLEVEDGDIELNGASGRLIAELEDGNLDARHCSFNEAEITCDDGDINLEMDLFDDGYYNFDTEDGNVSLKINKGGGNFDIRHDDGRIRATSDFHLSFDNESRHEFKLNGGNGKVSITTDDGSVSLATN